jgi:hypothetical protein
VLFDVTPRADAEARADVGHDHAAGIEVIEAVGHDGRLLVVEARRGIAKAGIPLQRAIVAAIDALDFEARADEVVADRTADYPAGRRIDVHDAADIGHVHRSVEHPVHAAFCADVEARILQRLSLTGSGHQHAGNGNQRSFHNLPKKKRAEGVGVYVKYSANQLGAK